MQSLEGEFNLPDCLLMAVGWVETRLVNELGDGGRGHGIFQLDDRSHKIPRGFDQNPFLQGETAAGMLEDLLAHYEKRITPACAAYNAGEGAVDQALKRGEDPDQVTTGGDYAAHVVAALGVLHKTHAGLVVAGQ
uniref:Transglycosylase SLT domain-containing protein n=1 Tax=uncultured prokaryote TaxID=198431 RepID=A0A0H5Q281_9ZZZZ|nr:hypothetical protein [uncultured prokaryote]